MANELLSDAVHASPLASGRGLLERLFTLAFSGLVYPQIWEDPAVDAAALRLGPGKRIVTIASGGCNVMNYLVSGPEQITAVDLNPAHVALLRLKLAAIRALPTHEQFFHFFGHADETANIALYDRFVAPALDPETRAYWQAPRLFGGRRIDLFARNVYRFGLLGRFIGGVHLIARLYGRNPRRMLEAVSLADQRRLFEETLAPVFETRLIRWLTRLPISLYGLGIPPAQYARLAAASGGDMAGLLRGRLEKLACDFPLEDNYFAWQAFGRGYDRENRRAIPAYLSRDNWETVRANAARATVTHASMTDHLALRPEGDLDGYVLLDAQDWMTPEQMRALWVEITRTARPGARVIFRTAGDDNPVPAILPEEIASAWIYEREASADFTDRDRSSIYGAFHLMRLA